MDRETAIKRVLYAYEEACFIACDPTKVLTLMSDNALGIGLGGQDTASSRDAIQTVLAAANRDGSIGVCAINYDNIEIRFPCETCANLSAKIILRHAANNKVTTSSFMQSLTLVLQNDQWRICQFHASPIMLSLTNTEVSSLLFSDTVMSNLHAQITTEAFDLMSSGFVGGVVGVHKVGDRYPLYFANEGIARLLGYTYEEFHQVFQEDVAKIFYPGDYEYVMKLTADVLERNLDVSERLRLQKKDGSLLPVIDYARKMQDSAGKDILIAVFTDITELVDLHEKLEAHNATILSSIRYASKIQKNLLPALPLLERCFADAHALWKPKDIVSGDIYWLKAFEAGTVLVVSDCTGHGTPGALITMLVSSILDNVVTSTNCSDTAQIVLTLDQKISSALNVHTSAQDYDTSITHIHDGCDLAVLFIAKNGDVTFSSSGIHIFTCNGAEVQQFKGQRLFVGDGALTAASNIKVTHIPASPDTKFYIASDGLYDQIGGTLARPFGYGPLKRLILEHHTDRLASISTKIWEAFEAHRGEHSRRDDVELISFQPRQDAENVQTGIFREV